MTWWQKKPFIDGINAYDKISHREQNIVLVTIATVLVLLGYLILIEPLLLKSQEVLEESSKLENINTSLALQIQKTREKQFQDPNEPLREKLLLINQQSEELQSSINLLTQALVAPKQMVSLLEKVLTQDKQLKLISLKNLPEEAMNIEGKNIEVAKNKENNLIRNDLKLEEEEEALIYKHAFEIELEATYNSSVSYLKRLDQLQWQLFWQTLKYESTTYPKGRLKIKIYTLSTSKEVLGV